MDEDFTRCKLYKILSRNDTGETNSHQSGISIPKRVAKSGIFPILGTEKLNPRTDVEFYDESKNLWKFQYIYYNDIYWGKPASKGHDEFRMTCVKDYIRENNIKAGDSIWFSIDENKIRHIGFEKKEDQKLSDVPVIRIGMSWRCIQY